MLLSGCKNPNSSNDSSENKDDEQVLWTDTSNGYTKKVVLTETTEDGEFEYIIMGGLSELQVNYLKNASMIKITLTSSVDSTRNTSFVCAGQFINNLIRYF